MAGSCKRLWILFIALFVLRGAKGHGVWNKGLLQDQRSIGVSPQLIGQLGAVSGQTSSSSSVTSQSSRGPSQSQPVQLSSPVSPSVAVPASGFVGGYQPTFQTVRFGGAASQPQLLGSSSSFVTQLQQQGVSGTPQQSPSGSLQSVASVQGFPSQQASAPQQQGSSWNQAGQSRYISSGSPQPQLVSSSSRLVTQLQQQQGVSGPPQQGALQQSPSGSLQSVASVQGFPSQQASTPQQQGSFWNPAGQSRYVSSGSPQPSSVSLSSQPQRSPEQLVYAFQAGSLSQPQSVGGGLGLAAPQGSYGVAYPSPSRYAEQGVSQQSRPGPLPQLKARLFTSQGASVTSSSPRPASDFAQPTGSPYSSVPSRGAATWQASSGVQAALSQVQGAPGSQYGAPVARFDQYSPASQTSGAYASSQQTGSPLSLPSQAATTWQASSSAPSQVQGAPSQVQGAPSQVQGAPSQVQGAPSPVQGQYGSLVARFDQYGSGSQTSGAYASSQQTGSPLSLPSQAATTWQASSSAPSQVQGAPSQVQGAPSQVQGAPSQVQGAPSQVQGAPSQVQGAPSQVQGAPSQVQGQYGSLVARFDQYGSGSQTSGAYELSRRLSSSYGGVQSQSGFAQTGSVPQPQQSSGVPSTPVLSSSYSGFPRLGSTETFFSRGLSSPSYQPALQRVSAQYDPSVKH